MENIKLLLFMRKKELNFSGHRRKIIKNCINSIVFIESLDSLPVQLILNFQTATAKTQKEIIK